LTKPLIPLFAPHVPETAIQKVSEVLRSGWVGQGRRVDEFEDAFSRKFGLEHVLAVNSGTSALRLALVLAGVRPGDEVISTPYTMVATNTVILEQYATPIFADIQYETLNIDAQDIEHRITKRTKAIVCVDFGGYPCELDDIRRIAEDHSIPLVEDAAHALGAAYKGKPIGAISDYASFSFQAVKHITTGDGGLLAVKDEKRYAEALRRRWFGIDRAGRKPTVLGHDPIYDITELGFKYQMNDIEAAIGLDQLGYFDRLFQRRAQIARLYREELDGIDGLSVLEDKSDRRNANWLFAIHVRRRTRFAETMRARGVEVAVHNWRNDKYTVFGGLRTDLPNLAKADETAICIPLHHRLTDEQVRQVVTSIKSGW
jgi:perosamine synthetase